MCVYLREGTCKMEAKGSLKEQMQSVIQPTDGHVLDSLVAKELRRIHQIPVYLEGRDKRFAD